MYYKANTDMKQGYILALEVIMGPVDIRDYAPAILFCSAIIVVLPQMNVLEV